MTGRDKILAAFTVGGTPEIGVVSCYDAIFRRDHWHELTDVPWWYLNSGVVEKELLWAEDSFRKSGLEWLSVGPCPSRATRRHCRYEQRPDGVWRVDAATGQEQRLVEPTPGGVNSDCAADRHGDPELLPASKEEVEALIPAAPAPDLDRSRAEGCQDVVTAFRQHLDLMLYGHIPSPVWGLYGLLGYEGMMLFIARQPALAAYAGRRLLENTRGQIRTLSALGADAVWIEECLTDQINPAAFAAVNVPLMQQCVREIRDCGLKSMYYYCGNPNDRLELILEAGADAVHFEEGKKGFRIDIEEIAARIAGRCTLFGNLDAIGVLQNGSEMELAAEIRRQIQAGIRNGGRFIMSTGSPITPGTPVARVRQYTDLAREFGGMGL